MAKPNKALLKYYFIQTENVGANIFVVFSTVKIQVLFITTLALNDVTQNGQRQ